ncbi:MAG: BACON domain-containing protein [Lachnospiraceae bacterium]|jgi:hypothetical protein|nr:BACON domain-containing protein [Lachnospiraceae bacterium]
MEIGIINTVSRYSGSQSPKHIAGNSVSFNITFNMPPLLGIDTKSLLFDKEGGTQKFNIAVQGTWSLKIKDAPSWIRADQSSGTGAYTEVFISTNENQNQKERQATLQIYRIKDTSYRQYYKKAGISPAFLSSV